MVELSKFRNSRNTKFSLFPFFPFFHLHIILLLIELFLFALFNLQIIPLSIQHLHRININTSESSVLQNSQIRKLTIVVSPQIFNSLVSLAFDLNEISWISFTFEFE